MDGMERRVTYKVHSEYKTFIDEVMKRGKRFAIDNSLKISFYREMHIYVLNGIVTKGQYREMDAMDEILETLWRRFKTNPESQDMDHFLGQLLEFHENNIERTRMVLEMRKREQEEPENGKENRMEGGKKTCRTGS